MMGGAGAYRVGSGESRSRTVVITCDLTIRCAVHEFTFSGLFGP